MTEDLKLVSTYWIWQKNRPGNYFTPYFRKNLNKNIG